jgi:hypothetical protein
VKKKILIFVGLFFGVLVTALIIRIFTFSEQVLSPATILLQVQDTVPIVQKIVPKKPLPQITIKSGIPQTRFEYFSNPNFEAYLPNPTPVQQLNITINQITTNPAQDNPAYFFAMTNLYTYRYNFTIQPGIASIEVGILNKDLNPEAVSQILQTIILPLLQQIAENRTQQGVANDPAISKEHLRYLTQYAHSNFAPQTFMKIIHD